MNNGEETRKHSHRGPGERNAQPTITTITITIISGGGGGGGGG